MFALGCFGYLIFSFLMSRYSHKFENKVLIITGSFLAIFGQFLIGPVYFLPNSLITISIGQFTLGSLTALILIPTLPELTSVAIRLYPDQKSEASDISSGAFNSMLNLGQMIGPLYGSYITSVFNFRI
mmetsp:Transcript_28191/g.24909  ORF Transcript_28191/g.24909 Transcript_28191/m.24909 type:complete len:128 (-) Transcript_28191:175-558(-)